MPIECLGFFNGTDLKIFWSLGAIPTMAPPTEKAIEDKGIFIAGFGSTAELPDYELWPYGNYAAMLSGDSQADSGDYGGGNAFTVNYSLEMIYGA